MSDLFPIPHSEKPELEVARDALAAAEAELESINADYEDGFEEREAYQIAFDARNMARYRVKLLEAAELERMKARQ